MLSAAPCPSTVGHGASVLLHLEASVGDIHTGEGSCPHSPRPTVSEPLTVFPVIPLNTTGPFNQSCPFAFSQTSSLPLPWSRKASCSLRP